MKRATFLRSPARRALLVLVSAAALTVVACDNDVNFNPAAPAFPNFTGFPNSTTAGPGGNIEILGSLRTEQGSCLEATVLYDGKELPGARAVCPQVSGCSKLELTADVRSTTGHHTISFRILNQSPEAVDYVAEGTVRVYREDLLGMVLTLPLKPTRATLRSGESVSFDEVDFLNVEN